MSTSTFRIVFFASFLPAFATVALADGPPRLYTLLPESVHVTEVCTPPCACPPHFIDGGVRGSFFLTFDHSDPLFDHYFVTSVHWLGSQSWEPIVFIGPGRYRIGGEVATMHQMDLDLNVNGEFDVHADSGLVPVDPQAPFPLIGIRVVTEIYGCFQTTFDLEAGPDRCPADLNGDGEVSLPDLALLLSNFGREGGAFHEDGDLDGDADVDLSDLATLLARFGEACP